MRNLEQQGYTESATQNGKISYSEMSEEQKREALRAEMQMLAAKKQRRKEMSKHE